LSMAAGEPTWSSLQEAIHVLAYPPFLRKTIGTALFVGIVQFLINHLDEVLRGEAQTTTWVKGAITCLVPFVVSNWGILIATRKTPEA
jgi:hypothetical protein